MRVRRFGAVLAAASLFVAACGGDDSATTTTPAPSDTTTAPDQTTAPDETMAPSDTTAPGATTAPVDTTAPSTPSGDMVIQPGVCGLGTGEAATGDPIKLGGAATNIPGVDFTWIPKMAGIYFDCVNANGGIYGHPIEYSYEDVARDPAVLSAAATKLVETDKVLAIVGNTELLECDVNGPYYAEKGYHPIIAGVAPGCFLSDQWSAVNMGPYYSNLGAAQAVVRQGAQGKLVVASPISPVWTSTTAPSRTSRSPRDSTTREFSRPCRSPTPPDSPSVVQAAGNGGGVVLNFTGPTVLPLLEAISQQGLVDSVIWGSSTPPNDPSVAAALADCCGTDWDGKFNINAEFNVLDSGLPDNDKMLEIHDAAGADFPISAFSQMGYLVGKFTTEALLRMGEGAEYNVETVNQAIYDLTNAESDMLCKPWYYTSGTGANVSNNTDRTVVPQGGVMVQKEDCFDIAAIDKDDAKGINGNPLGAIRAAEG